jgi:peptidyl-dipeptidase Dcp
VNDHPANKGRAHIAALRANAILRQRQSRSLTQPLRATADPQAGFVQMPIQGEEARLGSYLFVHKKKTLPLTCSPVPCTSHPMTNPFFEPWTTPFATPPFDRIRPAHFPPAFDRGMADNLDEIDAITANPAPPSFGNTIEALERTGGLLTNVGAVFGNLVASLGDDALQRVERDYAPKLAGHGSKVSLNPDLFARVAALYEARDRLDLALDARRLLERTYLGFVRSGAALDASAKARMAEISERLATLHTDFGQNVLHDERDWHLPLTEADLAGLPAFVRDGAAEAARERGLGGYAITLSRSLIDPFLTFSARRDLREIAYNAWIARGTHPGPHNNTVLIPEILALRAERARLLGYAHYADFRLADTMAGTPDAVSRLTGEVWQAALVRVADERAALLKMAGADGLGAMQAWDWRYYAEQVRQSEYALDEAALKPYFVFENIQQAAFDTAGRLFGLSFQARPDIATYHSDVRAYAVSEGDRHIGLFLSDPFARAGKRSGAWMSSYREQQSLDGEVRPIIVNNNNFAKASPALLSFDDAETLFHEFGHALHGLLSDVRFPSQSGTSVRRDFVEFPSQVYEHWLSVPETLQAYARHHTSNEPLPVTLMDRLLAARNFNQGFATIEYTAAAILDMELHAHPDPASLDIAAFERDALARLGMPAEIGVRHRPAHFQHLFAGAGYAAGYYSYLWAEVLDADGFAAFEDAGDPFDPSAAARLKHVLQSGDSEDPMALYVGFRGAAPGTAALLRNRGLPASI